MLSATDAALVLTALVMSATGDERQALLRPSGPLAFRRIRSGRGSVTYVKFVARCIISWPRAIAAAWTTKPPAA